MPIVRETCGKRGAIIKREDGPLSAFLKTAQRFCPSAKRLGSALPAQESTLFDSAQT